MTSNSATETLERAALLGMLRSAQLPVRQEDLHRITRDVVSRDRGAPLHVTGSALIIDPRAGQVLLRYHDTIARWMQVGGHADLDEFDPFDTAMREAMEETGLSDLTPILVTNIPVILQAVIVPVPATSKEQSHHHLDVRYLFTTSTPEMISAESASTPLAWYSLSAAAAICEDPDLATAIVAIDPWFHHSEN